LSTALQECPAARFHSAGELGVALESVLRPQLGSERWRTLAWCFEVMLTMAICRASRRRLGRGKIACASHAIGQRRIRRIGDQASAQRQRSSDSALLTQRDDKHSDALLLQHALREERRMSL
jgi:hypothetical protein